MTITNTKTTETFAGTGLESELTIDWPFYDDTDLVVIRTVTATGAQTTMSLTTDYTVAGGGGSTGTVTVVDGATDFPTSVTWTISRVTPRTQEINYVGSGPFDAQSHEEAMDRNVMISQELESETATLDSNSITKDPITGNWDAEGLVMNDLGDAILDTDAMNKQSVAALTAADVDAAASSASDAQTAQTAAEAAQTAAETAQTNAETAETNAETAETGAVDAQAASEAAALVLPDPTASDFAGQGVRVNSGQTAYEHGFPAPDYAFSVVMNTPVKNGTLGSHTKGTDIPKLVAIYVECIGATDGYSIGDVMQYSTHMDDSGGNEYSFYVVKNASTFYYSTGANGARIHPKTAGTGFVTLGGSDWEVHVSIWF